MRWVALQTFPINMLSIHLLSIHQFMSLSLSLSLSPYIYIYIFKYLSIYKLYDLLVMACVACTKIGSAFRKRSDLFLEVDQATPLDDKWMVARWMQSFRFRILKINILNWQIRIERYRGTYFKICRNRWHIWQSCWEYVHYLNIFANLM